MTPQAAGAYLSIVVPVYNEERVMGRLVDQLASLGDDCEVVFVDGGSTDATCSLVPGSMRLVSAPRGRGSQLNAGARAATGEVLLFLHADSVLPPCALGEIRRIVDKGGWGCFGVSFQPGGVLMGICRVMSNLRASVRGIPFGDQGMFMTRELFFAVGGFPDLPIMEDLELSLRLREMGLRPRLAARRIVTSSRRFGATASERLRTMYHMHRLRKRYRSGVPAEQIAQEYRDVR